MPSTLKSIIATVFYLCTLTTPVQIPHDRSQQLKEGFSSLINNIAYHQNHVTGPFTKALLDQMTAVKTQVSDLVVDLGCAEQKRMDDICYALKGEELRLRMDIVTRRMELYLYEDQKEVEKCKAETALLLEQEHGGWTIA